MIYKAFISYSQGADDGLASAIQSALQTFAKPWYRRRSIHVFLDKTGMAANPALWSSLESTLNNSEWFLLLASRRAAQSPWVEREVDWWLEHRSTDKMLILLTDGELVWNRALSDYEWERTTALPDNLRGQFKDEPLYVDFRRFRAEEKLSLRHTGFRSAVLNVAAPLYGRAKDDLDGEDVRQHKKNKLWAWSAAVALSVATVSAIVAAVFAIQQRHEAIAQRDEAVKQRNIAISRQLVTQSDVIRGQQPDQLPRSLLLAMEGMKRFQTLAADQALYRSLSLLGPNPIAERSYTGLNDLVLSPHGKYLVQIPFDGPAVIEEVVSGKEVAILINLSPTNEPLHAIRQVSFSANEQYVATRSSLGISTFVWELPSGRELFRTSVNRGAIVTAVLSDDGSSLATGHTDGKVYLWDVSSGGEILSFSHSDPPYIMEFSPDGRFLAVSSSLGVPSGPRSITMVRLWDLMDDREVAQLEHAGAVTQLAFSPNGKYLVTTRRVGQEQEKEARVGEVNIWETATGDEVSSVQHEEEVNSIKVTLDGKYLLTGSADDSARLWDLGTGNEQLSIDHGGTIELAGFLKVGDVPYFVTAGQNGLVRIWGAHIPPLEWLRLLESPYIVAFARDANAQHVATISRDLKADAAKSPEQFRKDVRVWTVSSIKKKLRLEHNHVVGGAHFSPDGRYLATFDFQTPASILIPKTPATDARFEYTDLGSGSVSVWEVPTRNRVAHLQHPGTVTSIDYDSTGEYLVTACVDGIVRVWDAIVGKEVANLERAGWILNAVFSPDGRFVAVSSGRMEVPGGKGGNNALTIWEWRTGRVIGQLPSALTISALAFSPDGQFLAAGGYDRNVYLMPITDSKEAQRFSHEDPVWALAFSPDGRYLVTGSGGLRSENSVLQRGATTLWNLGDGKKTVLMRHDGWTTTVAFSPDGRYLASMDEEGLLGFWSRVDGQQIAGLKLDEDVQEGKIHFRSMKLDEDVREVSIQFSNDSEYLVTSFGNKARIWEAATGREVARREHAEGYLWDAVLSPDDKYLATAGTDTAANLWLWRPEDLIDEACSRLSRNLTLAEWRQYLGEEVPYRATCANLE